MSDYFFKIWAAEKVKDWANEARRDEQARQAQGERIRSGRLRLWFGRPARALRVRFRRRPAEL